MTEDAAHIAPSPEPQTTDQETLETTETVEPVNAPGLISIPVAERADSDTSQGSTEHLRWGARSDVGLIRDHNEDSFLIQPPLFCVCDGMGGHAAGEVASAIATDTIGRTGIKSADDVALGAAIEEANRAIMMGAAMGDGKQGMGCTATAVYIDGSLMAVGHVGDSRVYVLHQGKLVRITHDHSYVEELVDAGEITADEARVHPSRSIITRALGSDPDMYADHFLLDIETGDRVIICSDGLSSMVCDSQIEAIAVSSATPQQAADNLVSEALLQGGHDNVTVIVVDVSEDGKVETHKRKLSRSVLLWVIGLVAVVGIVVGAFGAFIDSCWYLGTWDEHVAIYNGVDAEFLGIPLSRLKETTSVKVTDLPSATQKQLKDGILVPNLDEARNAVASYKTQIETDREKALKVGEDARTNADADNAQPAQDTKAGD